ncbi:branched-chain amino acid ABC transporter permease [Promicromonospora sp. NPDC060271]|uniref:branched-chain amino acid ABC transporter permease n=1 Tax=Promicromonospora sp. NPDC060271 TaxID=3347089 RepID=UPI00364B1577
MSGPAADGSSLREGSASARPSSRIPTVTRGGRASLVGGGVLLLVVVLLAAVVPYVVTLGALSSLVMLFALVILGTTWNLLAGYGGMVSVGQQAYVGVGGYALIQLADAVGAPPWLAVPAAGLIGAAIALPTSYLVFRLAGGYFAIGTWVVAEVFRLVTMRIDGLGGGAGLSLSAFRGTDRVERVAFVYWFALGLMVAVVLGTYLLMRSRVGLGLTAIRDDRVAAGSLGVAVDRGRRLVYVVGSAGAALAGALVALSTLGVTPGSIYSVNWTAAMIFIVVVGGIGTIEGPLVGAVLYWALQQVLAPLGTWYLVVLGAVAVAVVLLAPRGLWGLVAARHQLFPTAHHIHPFAVGTTTALETGR